MASRGRWEGKNGQTWCIWGLLIRAVGLENLRKLRGDNDAGEINWDGRFLKKIWISHSVQFSRSVMSDSLQHHALQHTRLPCPSPTPGAYSNSCPLCRWCHPTISSSVIPFSSCLQSFPASRSFPMSQFFASGGQKIGVSVSASILITLKNWNLISNRWNLISNEEI